MAKMYLKLEITEVRLAYCNKVKTSYQMDSRVLFIVVPSKSFD